MRWKFASVHPEGGGDRRATWRSLSGARR